MSSTTIYLYDDYIVDGDDNNDDDVIDRESLNVLLLYSLCIYNIDKPIMKLHSQVLIEVIKYRTYHIPSYNIETVQLIGSRCGKHII